MPPLWLLVAPWLTVLAVAERDRALIRERAAGLVLEVARRKVDVAAALVVSRAPVVVLAVAQRDCALIGERAAGLVLEVARRKVDVAADFGCWSRPG